MITTPSNQPGQLNLIAVNPDGQTFTYNNGFTYIDVDPEVEAPQVLGLTPNVSPEIGGAVLVINGRFFESTPSIFIGQSIPFMQQLLPDWQGLVISADPYDSCGESITQGTIISSVEIHDAM